MANITISTPTIITTSNNELVTKHIVACTEATNSIFKGTALALLIEEAKKQMREGVCHFIYTKKDGTQREAFGSLPQALLKKVIKGTGASPESWGCCYYFDIEKGASRSFKWENLVAVLS